MDVTQREPWWPFAGWEGEEPPVVVWGDDDEPFMELRSARRGPLRRALVVLRRMVRGGR